MSTNRTPAESELIGKIIEYAKTGQAIRVKELRNRDYYISARKQAVLILAKEGNEEAVQAMLQYQEDINAAFTGYAWGGHELLLQKLRGRFYDNDYCIIEGYALARNIDKVNAMLLEHYGEDEEADGDLFMYAFCGYSDAGYLKSYDSVLELTARTLNTKMRSEFIDVLAVYLSDATPPFDKMLFLAKANKISLLIKVNKIDYASALQVVQDLDQQRKEEAVNAHSLGLFQQAANSKLSKYQLKAIETIRGLSANIMLDWIPLKEEPEFSISHKLVLEFLINEKGMQPAEAVREISELSTLQVHALYDLYSDGLKGEQLRIWWEKNKEHMIFTEGTLNALIKAIRVDNKTPAEALVSITWSPYKPGYKY